MIVTQWECWCCFKERKKLSDEETSSEMVDRIREKEKEKEKKKKKVLVAETTSEMRLRLV